MQSVENASIVKNHLKLKILYAILIAITIAKNVPKNIKRRRTKMKTNAEIIAELRGLRSKAQWAHDYSVKFEYESAKARKEGEVLAYTKALALMGEI